jgi:DMSO/TMAO reductase YedYZ molybdopterin-dependent catalytic subunit
MSARVPPGQKITLSWPVLHAGEVPRGLDVRTYQLGVRGEVERPRTFSFADLLRLPQREVTCDIHCVTSWTRLGMRWAGVPFAALAKEVGARPAARFVIMECEQGFTTSLPIEALQDDDVLLAHTVDGAPLPSEHGGPVRMLVPKRYFYKSAKWLRSLAFVQKDEPGFWEVRGYSNIADPWTETRYDVDDVKVIHRMRKASLFRPLPPKGESGDPPVKPS